ncbi:FGGY-family carbohydrate kinase [Lichenihabitans sp. Uapishka_5]|uniref:FGGY-family carbohydrate kinase n=1 Tax=Lichenihabitans sp. Uapishka_5 TaxID=3037302 RepID=UPI0029E7F2CD|nr:FGGY-family carbohydrate kinase [Lichenihabitans sp. Uapishka_5]MDX7952120.1 FGGY-family carbohydrate kinase [Lichenihabitans sp. Uapishka_5]
MADAVIGIDIGTQSTKALLVLADGTILAQASRSYAPDTPHPNWAEQHPDVWLAAVEATVADVARAAGTHAVRGLCVSSLYGGSGIPVDRNMQPLHPCLIWMDRRAEAQVAWVKQNIDLARLGSVTGNGVDSYYGFTKMMWLRDERPDVWAETVLLLPPNAYVIQRLTGAVAVDHSSAGNIGGVYDVAARRWSHEILDLLGIPAALMPDRLVEPSEVVGGLDAAAAARLGLPEGTPVMAGGVDAAVATYAAGVVAPGHHVAMIGTSMCWGYVAPRADAAHGLISMPYVVNTPHDLYVFGGAGTAGASVSWFRDQFCQAEVEAGRAQGRDPHAILEDAAAGLPAGAEGLVFLPYLMGERSPVWDGQASGAFVGLNLFHTRAHLYRAVLEGVTLALRHNMEAGAKGAATLEQRLIVVGGAAKSDLWMGIVADVTGLPVWTIKEEVEAALGAARLAALGAGLIGPDDENTWITLVERATPTPSRQTRYDALFAVYAALYPALKTQMHALAALRGDA